jgi:hypothetical protein
MAVAVHGIRTRVRRAVNDNSPAMVMRQVGAAIVSLPRDDDLGARAGLRLGSGSEPFWASSSAG